MEAAAAAGLRKCFKEKQNKTAKKNTLEKERYLHLKQKKKRKLEKDWFADLIYNAARLIVVGPNA